MKYISSFDKLISLFSSFPGIGRRVAGRFVFFLLSQPQSFREELARSILDLGKSFGRCYFCQRYFEKKEKEQRLCDICQNPKRYNGKLCIVEKDMDLRHIEELKLFDGLYLVLFSKFYQNLSEKLDSLSVAKIKRKVLHPQKYGVETKFSEIILALNPTVEGGAVLKVIEPELRNIEGIKLKSLRLGLPKGGELEYADRETLKQALGEE